MVANDLRQRIRDKSVVIFSLLVPLALMAVLNLSFGGFDSGSATLKPAVVIASSEDSGQLGDALLEAVESLPIMDVTVRKVAAGDVSRETKATGADLGIILPAEFTAAVTSGQALSVQVVEGDSAGLETDVLISVVDGLLEQFSAGTVTAEAGNIAGLPHDVLGGLAQQAAAGTPALTLSEGQASAGQLSLKGTLVAGQAGLFLLFTVGFGVLGLLAEREEGTLSRLQAAPVTPGTIISAKALVGFILGVVATTVLLTAGSVLFGVSFGSPAVVALLVLAVAAAATSLTFIVARLVRSAEQANIAQSIVAMLLGIAGGAFFPIEASGFLATLMDLNPIAAFIRGLGITAGGGGIADVATPLAIMLGFAAVSTLASRLLPDRGVRA
ncbi:ABC transporter permease [Arthrobacter sp. OY3WO11]|jgi:ABC-2 type transport system permease protein|uniref:ABC transporter permease n=1 Tax=Arthrobacter sp. OY3WO11 TaxID=1835723 RepID=UPI0007CF58DB|nr:ABC transporter permease [Arthrobacter sp. OY3WO11]OAE02027.1 multidrug ABC transporter permease [Arthrobacter sp. OY3WO11]